ncbi:PRKCA-binding protein-like isoform X2 [Portunus trituberculatus]|nr:PRKCA-binding protein-like isoform X2 [Portunus trituberculatus]XP_045124624.1 PRKCA-binding protein-like isoform X2 [Portunus trituberculatus]
MLGHSYSELYQYSLLPLADPDEEEEVRRKKVMDYYGFEDYFEDRMGMTVTSGTVTLEKNDSNLIGISIGGGAKLCPCLYVVQVFDNTAAAREGTLQSGDEITGVNGVNVKGRSKQEVAQMIQRSQGTVTIHYNKLHADPKQGKTLDIAMKKMKHRLVENLSSSTADALGLSRAILCNDSLVKKLGDLQRTEEIYQGLVDHTKRLLKAFLDLAVVYRRFGDVFCEIGVRELQQSANEAFSQFGEAHRQMEKCGIVLLTRLKPILSDLGTYLHKAIPDTRLTIRRYADAKFEYLSYCLKVKEMDDEEMQFAHLQEPLYRIETGNYEYRLVLRCRQDARAKFARLRSDVLVKLELLDSKHVQHLTQQLQRLAAALAANHNQCHALLHGRHWFPIELDMSGTTLHEQHQHNQLQTGFEDDDEEEEEEEEVGEDLLEVSQNNKVSESNDLIQPLRDLNLTSSRPEGEVKEGAFEEVNLLGDY